MLGDTASLAGDSPCVEASLVRRRVRSFHDDPIEEVLRRKSFLSGDSRAEGLWATGDAWDVARTGEAGVGAGMGAGAADESAAPLFRLFFLFFEMKEGMVSWVLEEVDSG